MPSPDDKTPRVNEARAADEEARRNDESAQEAIDRQVDEYRERVEKARVESAKPVIKSSRLKDLFDELTPKREALQAERAKVREELEAITHSEKVNQLRARMKEINAELGPIENEYAALARALGPKASIRVEPGEYKKTESEG